MTSPAPLRGTWRPSAMSADGFAHFAIPTARVALCGRRVLAGLEADTLRVRCPSCAALYGQQRGAA